MQAGGVTKIDDSKNTDWANLLEIKSIPGAYICPHNEAEFFQSKQASGTMD